MKPTSRSAVVPPILAEFFRSTGVPGAVIDGDTVYTTGHTGEEDDLTFSPDPVRQLRRTFVNLGETLAHAGADWSDVVQLVSFHVGLRAQADALIAVAHEFLAEPLPAWSAVGVTELWDEGSIVEISCIAVRHASS